MGSLTVADVIRKTHRVARCPRCDGTGREGFGHARRPCGCCGGKGSVRVIDDAAAVYEARQAGDLLEVDAEAAALVARLLPTLQFFAGDVTVWRVTEHDGPRVVALITSGPDGNTVTRWL